MNVSQLGPVKPARAEAQSSVGALHLIKQLPRKRRAPGRWFLFLIGCGAVVALAAWASDRWGGHGPEVATNFRLFEVDKAPLDITVVEQGNMESTSNIDIRCEVEG